MSDDMFDFEVENYFEKSKICTFLIPISVVDSNVYIYVKRVGEYYSVLNRGLKRDKTSKSIAMDLLYEIFGLKQIESKEWPAWTVIQLVGVYDNVDRIISGDREVAIVYGTILPTQIKIKDELVEKIMVKDLLQSKKMVHDHADITFDSVSRFG